MLKLSSSSLAFVAFALSAAPLVLAQVDPSATGGATVEDDSRMLVPSLLSNALYAPTASVDARHNFLTGEVGFESGYIDNINPSTQSAPAADFTNSIAPELKFDRNSPRQTATFNYTPRFTFYTPNSNLNSMDNGFYGSYQGRLTEHITLGLDDSFIRTSNVFNESYPFASGGLSGSAQSPVPAAIAPYAEQLRNTADADLSYQFSANGMIGGGGTFSTYRFPNPSQSVGLYNSDGAGGSAFYSRRLTNRQYVGVTYEYNRTLAYPATGQIETQSHTLLPFYTVFFNRTFSLSAAGGAVRSDTSQPKQATLGSWDPAVVLSFGWQGVQGNIAASFLRTVVSGGGLLGAFTSTSASLDGSWKFGRYWTVGAAFTYENIVPEAPIAILINQGGNSLMAQGSVSRSFGEHFIAACGYQRFHEQFGGIQSIAVNPDADRGYGTITYVFRKSLGR
jgi:hypothetical protein